MEMIFYIDRAERYIKNPKPETVSKSSSDHYKQDRYLLQNEKMVALMLKMISNVRYGFLEAGVLLDHRWV